MPVLPPKAGGKKKRPSMRGVMMADVSQGAERLRAWPRKRPAKPTEKQLEQREWFRKAQWAYRYQDPKIQEAFADATAGTPFMPRDLFTQMLAGRFCFVRTSDGKLRSPMAAKIDVSASLDVISQTPGFTLRRGPEYWEGAAPAAGGITATRAERSSNIAAWTTVAAMPWQLTEFDDNGAWNIAQPTRLTIPTGINRASFTASCFSTGGSAANMWAYIARNGTEVIASGGGASGYANNFTTVDTGVLLVTPGDYFEFMLQLSNASSKQWMFNRCFFAAQFFA